jgi:hypothetical protein
MIRRRGRKEGGGKGRNKKEGYDKKGEEREGRLRKE